MANDILLRDVPEDLLKIILKKQGYEKTKRLAKQYSLSHTVFKIIRETGEKKKPNA